MSTIVVVGEGFGENACHLSLREGSVAISSEILSEAKDDRLGPCWC
jgi:hypothetical protein